MNEGLNKAIMEGKDCRFKGHHHTEESKRKISEKTKGVPKSDETKRKMKEHNAMKRKVGMYDINTGKLLLTFNSMKEGADLIKERTNYKATSGQISSACTKHKKTAYGYIWKYI